MNDSDSVLVTGTRAGRVAAIYARVSSDRQRREQTIASQTAALRELAEERALVVPAELVFEDDGFSGANLNRPALEQLRDRAFDGCFEVVLCHAPDRLARRYAYQVLLLEELARGGIEVAFAKEPERSGPPEDELLRQFQGMIAEYGKRRTTGRKKGMEESYVEDLASHGGPGHALATREGAAKRWIQGARRPAIEPRNAFDWGADAVVFSEGNTAGGVIASRRGAPRGLRTRHACDLFMPRTGRSHGRPPVVMVGRAARGRSRP